MPEYRLYFLDRVGHVAARFEYDAGDDAAALMATGGLRARLRPRRRMR